MGSGLDDADLGTSRGRTAGRGVGTPCPGQLYVASSDLDVLDETSPLWAPRSRGKRSVSASEGRSPRFGAGDYGLRDESAVGGGRYGDSILLEVEVEGNGGQAKDERKEREREKGKKGVRPGSTPPAPSLASPWSVGFSDVPPYAGEGFYRGVGLGLVAGPGAQLLAIPGRTTARSRSVGWDSVGEDCWRRHE